MNLRTRLALGLLACWAAGCATEPTPTDVAQAPAPAVGWFEEVAVARGLEFTHHSGHEERPFLPEIMVGGAALFDMDGDDDLDAYLVQSGSLTGDAGDKAANRLFRNLGDGKFEDITAGSGAGDRGYGMGVAAGDYDNDGDVDLYVTNVGPNALLRNEGNGRFVDRTAEAGVGHPGWGSSTTFVDYDRDGDLDLYGVNYVRWSVAVERDCRDPLGQPDFCSPSSYEAPAVDVLYRNDGDGTFSDATEAMGIGQAFGNGLGVGVADFDNDGWLDVFIANDATLDQLWHNEEGRGFSDVALVRGCAADQEGLAKAGMGVAVGDIENDGDVDLMVCNIFAESDSYFRNDGDFFTDVTARGGLGVTSRQFTRFGLGWVDFDNDGHFDLYEANGRVTLQARPHGPDPFAEPNLLFKGHGSGRFDEILPRGGTPSPLIHNSRAAAFGDVDGDGGIDILVANCNGPAYLLRNVAPDRGNWILFRVVDEHGRDAEGARLSFSLDGHRVHRDVRSAYSYLASNSPRVHAGLGASSRVEDVVVRWVDGESESFGAFAANARVTLRRGEGSP